MVERGILNEKLNNENWKDGRKGLTRSVQVSGGREGSVKVWDTRVANKPVVSGSSPSPPAGDQVNMEPETGRRECWAVTAGNSHGEEERMVGLTLTPQGS